MKVLLAVKLLIGVAVAQEVATIEDTKAPQAAEIVAVETPTAEEVESEALTV